VDIGRNIRVARKQSGLTQELLAENADINPKHLSAVENGKSENLSIGYIVAIAMALGVDYTDLLTQPVGVNEK